MINSFCAGHVNDFAHLNLGFEGLESEYDLGFKFEERESDKFHVDSKTGIKVWAEPLLVLYVSVVQRSSQRTLPTLRYGLTRSKFAAGLRSNPDDRERLLEIARPHVRESVITMKAGGTPEEARDVVML